jgi:hypothetical protein
VSRLFDGVDDQMVYDIPASSSGQGANITWGTILIVVKILQGDGSWMSFFEKEHNNGTSHGGFGRHSNNSPYMAFASSLAENGSGIDVTDGDGWMVVAVTKVTGTATPNIIKCPIGGSVSANAATSTIGNLSDSSNGRVRVGGNDDWANMLVAAEAAFQGIVLTTTDVQGIADAATTQAIADLLPTWLIDDSDGLATCLMGSGHDRASVTGTADSGDDPTGWVYGLGGGGGTPQLLAASIASASAVSAALRVSKPLAASIAGSSSVSAALRSSKPLSASIQGTSTVGAALSVSSAQRLAASIASQSGVTASLRATKLLAASIASTSSVAASLAVPKRLAATIAGGGTVAAALRVGKPLAASIASTSSVVARLTVGGAVAATGRVYQSLQMIRTRIGW